jgi:hypothetical protein
VLRNTPPIQSESCEHYSSVSYAIAVSRAIAIAIERYLMTRKSRNEPLINFGMPG